MYASDYVYVIMRALAAGKRQRMTQHARKAVRSIGQKMERNISALEQRVAVPGRAKPDPAIIRSAAKYREALERLARE